MPKLLLAKGQKGWPLLQRLLVGLFTFLHPYLSAAELTAPVRILYRGALRILLVLLHDFPEFLCDFHFCLCDVIPPSCIQMRNLILSAFPRNMRLPDPFTPNLKVDLLPEISQSPRILSDFSAALTSHGLLADLDAFLNSRTPFSVTPVRPEPTPHLEPERVQLAELKVGQPRPTPTCSHSQTQMNSLPFTPPIHLPPADTHLLPSVNADGQPPVHLSPTSPAHTRWQLLHELRKRIVATDGQQQIGLMNALVLHVGSHAIATLQSSSQGTGGLAHSAPMDIFQQLTNDLQPEGRYLFLNAIANQLRYPNNHTHYFSCVLLYLFFESQDEQAMGRHGHG